MNFVGGGQTTGNGILIQPTSGSHSIAITNTTATNNGWVGVFDYAQGTATTGIVIDRVSANNNHFGIAINNSNLMGLVTASISNSIASFNTSDGFYFQDCTASLDASYATGNSNNGVFIAGGTLVLGRSVLMNNSQYGLYNDGTVNSYQDNRIAGNGMGPVLGPPTAAPLY